MGSVAVDSGVIIALFDSNDVHHAWSMEQIQQIVTARHAIVISALTVAEVPMPCARTLCLCGRASSTSTRISRQALRG